MPRTLLLQDKLFIIDQLPVFAGLSLKDKTTVADSSVITEYKKGDIVYREGEPADAFYCVITGRLKAYISKGAAKEDLEYIKRGKYFGIVSLLTGERHSATVEAVNDSILLRMGKEDFARLLKDIPSLAIHMSQTLSRRLRRKDLHEKKVFESTIISVFGASDKVGATNYTLNLAASLKIQTGKRVIVLDLSKTGEDVAVFLGFSATGKALRLGSPFFDENLVRKCIIHHSAGIDLIGIPHQYDDPEDAGNIIPLLSYLTNDYHYVLVDLPGSVDRTAFESMKQSDVVHLMTAADEPSLSFTAKMISDLVTSSPDIEGKIKVITSEYGIMKLTSFNNRKNILKHEVFATLPDAGMPREGAGLIVLERPDVEYSRAIRRISREIGECMVGLALGCGAAMGLAHIGIIRVLEDERIPIDVAVGTSIGALIGALWASGKSMDEIGKAMGELFRKRSSVLRMADLIFPRKGLIKGKQVYRFLKSQFGSRTFYDLKLPFKVVACDIEKREEMVIDRGSLADAVMASIAIPGVFEPVKWEGRLLVDGGIINPLPTSVLTRMGVTKIIAVNALPSPGDIQQSKKRVSNIFDIMVNSMQASEYLLAEFGCQNADISLHPIISSVGWYEFDKNLSIIRRGEEEARKVLPQLKELVASR